MNLGHISLNFCPLCQSCNITTFFHCAIYVMSCTCIINRLLSVQLGNKYFSLSLSLSLSIVMEYFVESLVLLRRRMCWPISDMVYLVQRESKFSKTKNAIIPRQARQAHQYNSYADYVIYNFLTKKMLQEMALQNYFLEEVDTLKRIIKTLAALCQPFLEKLKLNPWSIHEIEKRNDSITFNPEPWGDPFTIFSVDCAVMKVDTVVFRSIVKVRQMPKLCISPSIKRKWQTGTLYINIRSLAGTVIIHKSYCQDMHPRFFFWIWIQNTNGSTCWQNCLYVALNSHFLNQDDDNPIYYDLKSIFLDEHMDFEKLHYYHCMILIGKM